MKEVVEELEPGYSPLRLVMREPALHDLVRSLTAARHAVADGAAGPHVLRFSERRLAQARQAFMSGIIRGERKLHHLCEVMGLSLFDGPFEMWSVVFGEIEASGERFNLTQPLPKDVLYGHIDLDIGHRLLQRVRFREGERWCGARLIANYVEYQPLRRNPHHIHKMISRIKAEEEIWNKVADEIFDLDTLVKQDKQLAPLNRFIKDVFGVKIVVDDERDVAALQQVLRDLRFAPEHLARIGVPSGGPMERLEFLEVKDYLSHEGKKTGWKAIKSVVRWWGQTFEIQIQPLGNYFLEREVLTSESHSGFKAKREEVRNKVAAKLPLFGFYRDLLKWLFLRPGGEPPRMEGVVVEVTD